MTIRKLVNAILIPQISYGISLLVLPKYYLNKINQILAIPFRRCLGMNKSCSAARLLWEFGIPDAHTLLMSSTLRTMNRSARASPSSITAIAAGDAAATAAAAGVGDGKSSMPTTSLMQHFAEAKRRYGLSILPIDNKHFNSVIEQIATSSFHSVPKLSDRARTIKPTWEAATYLSIDPRPIVSIRARIRLNQALSFSRLHLYNKVDSPNCPRCRVRGDTKHILLDCPVFHSLRQACLDRLSRLPIDVSLTYDLICGLPPPIPPAFIRERSFCSLIHHLCLQITGDYIKAVSSKHFL